MLYRISVVATVITTAVALAAPANAASTATLSGAKDAKAPAAAAATPKNVVFPQSIDKKFANEKPASARMHTCLEQYRINKKNNALGGMTWMKRGGGYYSLCNARLKG